MSTSKSLLMIIGLTLSIGVSAKHIVVPKVIYGNDDRYEVEEYSDKLFRDYAQSVAGMVKSYKLAEDPEDSEMLRFSRIQAQRSRALCKDEKYADQYTLPICSGFLQVRKHGPSRRQIIGSPFKGSFCEHFFTFLA